MTTSQEIKSATKAGLSVLIRRSLTPHLASLPSLLYLELRADQPTPLVSLDPPHHHRPALSSFSFLSIFTPSLKLVLLEPEI